MNHRPEEHQPGRRPVIVGDRRRADQVALTARRRHQALGGPPGGPDRVPAGGPPEEPGPGPADAPAGPPGPPAPDDAEALRAQLRERTADLQRVKAEYDNYRKRVRRDHLAVREIAVANVLTGLLPVLDAIDAARDQGEVTGGVQRITAAFEERLAALGLESLGEPGEAFDPAVHEAVDHTRSGGVTRPTCVAVHRPGYRVGQHLLRPAEVTVAEPPAQAPPGPPPPPDPGRP